MGKIEFDPVKEEKDGVRARRTIWTSKVLEAALTGLEQGRKLIANPFYENNTRLLKSDLVFQRTEWEKEEFRKCMNDIVYFANTYCKLMTPEGVKSIILRDYQEKYLHQVVENQLNIMCSCRQAAKTTTSAIFMLHFVCFNTDKNALILGNKRKTAVDILSKLKSIFFELPYFLKPGVMKFNEGEIALDNGCTVKAEATTINSGIGMTIHCCLMDEFAHIAPNIIDQFYNNLFPVLTAGKGKCIITSTVGGYNLFYRLCMAAKSGENDYAYFEVTWDMVPEWDPDKRCWVKRDEEWHQKQVANYGSEEAFNQQFGTSFDVSSNTLISSRILKKRSLNLKEFVHKDMDSLFSEYFWWDPDYDLEDLRHDWIAITTDIAEGLGGDFTVNMINKLYISNGEVRSTAIGFFKCNTYDVPACASAIRGFCVNYLDPMKYLFSIEYNLFGELYIRTLKDEMNQDFVNYEKFSEANIVRYYTDDEQKKYTLGIRMNQKTKLLAVTQFKQKYEKGIINNQSSQFMNELQCFCDNKGNNTYQASFGHDDLVMAQLQMAPLMNTPQFKELISMMEMYSDSNIQRDFVDLYASLGGGSLYGDMYQMNEEISWRDRMRLTNSVERPY